MPGGGSVEISTADCTEAAGPFGLGRRSYVRVRVRDTGSGMPQQVRDRIFDPFFTTKGDRGTGIGLAQVLGGMRGIGGDARASSTRGGGTTVALLFPRLRGGGGKSPGQWRARRQERR